MGKLISSFRGTLGDRLSHTHVCDTCFTKFNFKNSAPITGSIIYNLDDCLLCLANDKKPTPKLTN